MGLGDTAKRLQKVIDAAEQLYAKMNEIIGELKSLQTEVEHTSEQVDRMERDLHEQRALVEALAENADVDVEAALADLEVPDDPAAEDADTDVDGDAGSGRDADSAAEAGRGGGNGS